jgi:hypothetical protein
MMDKVQNPSKSVCYTPSSEPYRIYLLHLFGYLFISSLFNDAVTNLNDWMIVNNELGRMWEVLAVVSIKVLSWHLSGGD